ncbi:U4/U6.U5 tri-snRNP-associated protein 2-like, partial [Terrapene carolina triunguis]|uniref:U4/U6.U5 tri-snRNP-associated protein 2-like n=1 Tax=Terrapene triunguis TaxID=2587831 RepID=UPI00115618C1
MLLTLMLGAFQREFNVRVVVVVVVVVVEIYEGVQSSVQRMKIPLMYLRNIIGFVVHLFRNSSSTWPLKRLAYWEAVLVPMAVPMVFGQSVADVEGPSGGFERDEVEEFLLELFGEGFGSILQLLTELWCGVFFEFFIAASGGELLVLINIVVMVEDCDGTPFVCWSDRYLEYAGECGDSWFEVAPSGVRGCVPTSPQPAEEKEQLLQNDEYQETMVESTFMYLTLDLPTAPLYKDEKEQLIIPQVPLFNILAKFNGITEKEYKTYKENFLKRFQLTKLPPYLIFCIKRFTKNNFFVEKNPTIVNFPITNVDLREYLSEEVQAVHKNTTYDLIANIVHDGKPTEGSYRIHVLHHGTGKWYELQDLQVTDILPQMITLSEAYIQ